MEFSDKYVEKDLLVEDPKVDRDPNDVQFGVPKEVPFSPRVNHHDVNFERIHDQKLIGSLTGELWGTKLDRTKLAVMCYSISEKKNAFPLKALFSGTFISRKSSHYMQPELLIPTYAKKPVCADLQRETNEKISSQADEKMDDLFQKIQSFLGPIMQKNLRSMDYLIELYDAYKVEEFDDASVSRDYFTIWQDLRHKIQEKYNFRIAIMEGQHRLISAACVLRNIPLSHNLNYEVDRSPLEQYHIDHNISKMHQFISTHVFIDIEKTSLTRMMDYSSSYWKMGEKHFSRNFNDDIDMFCDVIKGKSLFYDYLLHMSFNVQMSKLRKCFKDDKAVGMPEVRKCVPKNMDVLVDICFQLCTKACQRSCLSTRKDIDIIADIFCGFFGSGFLSPKILKDPYYHNSSKDFDLPRKYCVLFDLLRMCVFDTELGQLFKEFCHNVFDTDILAYQIEKESSEGYEMEIVDVMEEVLLCIFETSEIYMKHLQIKKGHYKSFSKKRYKLMVCMSLLKDILQTIRKLGPYPRIIDRYDSILGPKERDIFLDETGKKPKKRALIFSLLKAYPNHVEYLLVRDSMWRTKVDKYHAECGKDLSYNEKRKVISMQGSINAIDKIIRPIDLGQMYHRFQSFSKIFVKGSFRIIGAFVKERPEPEYQPAPVIYDIPIIPYDKEYTEWKEGYTPKKRKNPLNKTAETTSKTRPRTNSTALSPPGEETAATAVTTNVEQDGTVPPAPTDSGTRPGEEKTATAGTANVGQVSTVPPAQTDSETFNATLKNPPGQTTTDEKEKSKEQESSDHVPNFSDTENQTEDPSVPVNEVTNAPLGKNLMLKAQGDVAVGSKLTSVSTSSQVARATNTNTSTTKTKTHLFVNSDEDDDSDMNTKINDLIKKSDVHQATEEEEDSMDSGISGSSGEIILGQLSYVLKNIREEAATIAGRNEREVFYRTCVKNVSELMESLCVSMDIEEPAMEFKQEGVSEEEYDKKRFMQIHDVVFDMKEYRIVHQKEDENLKVDI